MRSWARGGSGDKQRPPPTLAPLHGLAASATDNRDEKTHDCEATALLPGSKGVVRRRCAIKVKRKLKISKCFRRKAEKSPRVLRSTPDWGARAVSGEHLWSPIANGDSCYVVDCQRHDTRMQCSACKIVVHQDCIDILYDRDQFFCKPTFKDVGVRQYREETAVHHHWVHQKPDKGKCKACGKALQAALFNSAKEMILKCSWCKDSYHKGDCFKLRLKDEDCSLGAQGNIIVPPSWIVKLPRKGSFKSSLRKSPMTKIASVKKEKDLKNDQEMFVIKSIPNAPVKPVIVFINPRSGGNQGLKLLQQFQWLLNPRQVFDLTQGGPRPGLQLFKYVPNLRILACGGDGTVGWVLSELDGIGITPAVGVLPLGTGNDLARSLGWGGGYEDEPISKILAQIGKSDTVLLDRWRLAVEPNDAVKNIDPRAKPEPPLTVVNNYFSIGVDAHIALEFHEAREAHPEKFNSRLRNKIFYGKTGGIDLVQRKWKNLSQFVTLECDGVDLTPVLKRNQFHAIVFLNIPSYGGGTRPWDKSGGDSEPSTEDGLIEVVGLTTFQLPLLQAGAHGTGICQCKTAKLVTSEVIPMQVDGEACRVAPSIITISRLNQAIMLAKKKSGRVNTFEPTKGEQTLTISLITMAAYESLYHDKELLAGTAVLVGKLQVQPDVSLAKLRSLVQNLIKESVSHSKIVDWWFIDSVTAECCFRVDKTQEAVHFPSDIGQDVIYILEEALVDTAGPDTAGASLACEISKINETEASRNIPTQTSEELTLTPCKIVSSPTPQNLPSPLKVPLSPMKAPPSPPEVLLEPAIPPICTKSPPEREYLPSRDSIVRFKTNILEKTSESLIKAAKAGDLKLIKDLHHTGNSLLAIDATGQTALHIAARYGHRDIVQYLITAAPTAILNMSDNKLGQTALHKAAAEKRKTICYMLVAAGASLTPLDHAGLTPLQLAIKAGDQELVAYLKNQELFLDDLGTAV